MQVKYTYTSLIISIFRSTKTTCILNKDRTKTTDQLKTEQIYGQQTLFSLSSFGNKKVEVQFTTEQISTDGGLLFLKEVDENIGLIGRIAACLYPSEQLHL